MCPSPQSALNRRYTAVSEEKSEGATYTPKNLADFVAAQIYKTISQEKIIAPLRILDPAVGDGELLISLLEQFPDHEHKNIEVHGFETDIRALNRATARIQQRFPKVKVLFAHQNFLEFAVHHADTEDRSLFSMNLPAVPAASYDLIIANPPYVRTQIMGAEQAQLLARQFGLSGRVDLYYAFLIGMAFVLKRKGIAGVIVSNRFMTTKSGGMVRQAIRKHFNIKHVWDLGDTKLFDAAVLPAVLLLQKQTGHDTAKTRFTSIYSTTELPVHQVSDAIAALDCDQVVETDDGRCFRVKEGTLEIGLSLDSTWRVATTFGDNWLATVASNTWGTFGDLGKIRVGVKTCADKVFIRSDWDDLPASLRPELLRPLITHHVGRRFRSNDKNQIRQILYPHENIDGQRSTINLQAFPRAKAYLEQHRKTLEARSYVIEAGRQWYEIWVPHDPEGWSRPKLVFRDISEEPIFWIDLEGSIVNGDCYWLACEQGKDVDFLWLAAAVSNSTFIEAFYDHSFNNKLYAGRRRFITQYVEKFPLPDPNKQTSKQIIKLAKRLYESPESQETQELSATLNGLVWEAFGLQVEEVSR